MTLSNTIDDSLTPTELFNGSTSHWDTLYCSHIWSNSNLRKAIINGSDNKMIKYCYTCRGKIRKYEIGSPKENFVPNNHSTPNKNKNNIEVPTVAEREEFDDNSINVEITPYIPSISYQIDSSFRQKFTSYEMRSNDIGQRRLRKSLKGIGCIVNFALTESPVKKRTQIQACSISVMIVAIVVISFVLVNFTSSNYTRANVVSTIVVPTSIDSNDTSLLATISTNPIIETNEITQSITVSESTTISGEDHTPLSDIILKIRNNIKTFQKDTKKNQESQKPKEIINRDLSSKFCSCQKNEVCMLEENTGTSICKKSLDSDDPTGCGGLCALETEACQLVDRARGVRVCKLISLVTCSAQEWRCRNGLCVPAEARCDGSVQCYDRSDEMQCECDLTRHFRCGHATSCFPNWKLCDGIIDCWDGLDEFNCTAKCPEKQFTCTNGQCIPTSRFCDGLADCEDNSDEPQGCEGACGEHEIRCKNQRCISRTNKCDGHDDCGDNTDETQCS